MGDNQTELLQRAANLLCTYAASASDESQPVVRLASPQQLLQAFVDAGVPLQLDGNQRAYSVAELIGAMRTVLRYSVRTHHPLFFNQLYARPEPSAVAGEWLAAAATTNVHTFEVAPVFTLVEQEVLAKLASYIGYACEEHDGLFVPGGSMSNLYAMHLARHVADPGARARGAFGGPHLIAFTSRHSHYSYTKASFLMGLGTDNLIKVACDESGAMLPSALEEAIAAAKAEGKVPFFVGCTAGTTVTGAFDPFRQIAEMSRRHGMWMHIDGSWGGSLLLSHAHRHVLDGCDLSDSFAWNAHKMMGTPLQCSAFLTRHRGLLASANAVAASYLFQQDKLHAEADIGDKTLQCGRRADAFKLWLQWRALGDDALAARVEHCVQLAKHVEASVKASSGRFVLVMPSSCTNVCFWYVPPSLRPFDPCTATPEQWTALGRVAPTLKQRMQSSGDALIGYQPLGQLPNFFRIVFASALSVTFSQLDSMLERMNDMGQDL